MTRIAMSFQTLLFAGMRSLCEHQHGVTSRGRRVRHVRHVRYVTRFRYTMGETLPRTVKAGR